MTATLDAAAEARVEHGLALWALARVPSRGVCWLIERDPETRQLVMTRLSAETGYELGVWGSE